MHKTINEAIKSCIDYSELQLNYQGWKWTQYLYNRLVGFHDEDQEEQKQIIELCRQLIQSIAPFDVKPLSFGNPKLEKLYYKQLQEATKANNPKNKILAYCMYYVLFEPMAKHEGWTFLQWLHFNLLHLFFICVDEEKDNLLSHLKNILMFLQPLEKEELSHGKNR